MKTIVQRAIDIIGKDTAWEDDEARKNTVDQLGQDAIDKLDLLHREFYTYPDNLTDLLHRFVRSHSRTFAFPPNFRTIAWQPGNYDEA